MAEFMFSCPKCKKNIQCDATDVGSRINCPVCQQTILVPPAAPLPQPIRTKSSTWRNVLIVGSCLLLVFGIIALTVYLVLRPKTLTFKVSVDGADIVKLSGNKLWMEHQSFQLPTKAMINGKKWDPIWDTNTSMPYVLSRAFRPGAPEKIQLSKQRGRGTISILEMPSPENDETLAIKLDDNDASGGRLV